MVSINTCYRDIIVLMFWFLSSLVLKQRDFSSGVVSDHRKGEEESYLRLKAGGEVGVFTGVQISAPLVWATPNVYSIGTRHKPLLLRLYSSNSSWFVVCRYGALRTCTDKKKIHCWIRGEKWNMFGFEKLVQTLTCSWRNCMYCIASRRTDAVSVCIEK